MIRVSFLARQADWQVAPDFDLRSVRWVERDDTPRQHRKLNDQEHNASINCQKGEEGGNGSAFRWEKHRVDPISNEISLNLETGAYLQCKRT